MVWSGKAGEIATGKVDDVTGAVLEAWTGPQVAWTMARGGAGRVRRQADQQLPGLARVLRRVPARPRRLAAAVLAAEPRPARAAVVLGLALVLQPRRRLRGDAARLSRARLAARPLRSGSARATAPRAAAWSGRSGCSRRRPSSSPASASAERPRLERDRRRLRGRDRRRAHLRAARARTGNFPVEDGRPKCGPADSAGEVRDRIQTNGRCETANPHGDTYGPVAYARVPARLPALRLERQVGHAARRRTRRRSCGTCSACSGSRSSGGGSAGHELAAARSRSPGSRGRSRSTPRARTRTTLIQPALLIWGFYFATRAGRPRRVRGALVVGEVRAAAAACRSGAAIPTRAAGGRGGCSSLGFAGRHGGCVLDPAARAVAGARGARVLRPHDRLAARPPVAVLALGLGRSTTRRASPTCTSSSTCSRRCSSSARSRCWRWPRRRSPLQLAALTAALLIGFELVLTHWFFLYLPWFFPFAAFALLSERPPPEPVPEPADEHPEPVLAAT